jgi:hypothetical protein
VTATVNGLAAGLLWQMSTWATHAACLTVDAQSAGDWNGDTYSDSQADALAAYCLGCPVAGPCLELALVLDVRAGIRGGLTPAERLDYLGDADALSQRPAVGTDAA